MANTTGQDQSIGERAVIGTATEVTIPEDERPTMELPPEEAVPNLQTERKIDQTILDKQINPNFADANAKLGVCNDAEHKFDTVKAKPVPQNQFSSPLKDREIIKQQVVETEKRGSMEYSFCPDTQQPTPDEAPPIIVKSLPIKKKIQKTKLNLLKLLDNTLTKQMNWLSNTFPRFSNNKKKERKD